MRNGLGLASATVTGMGCICAAGASVPECMETMLRGERRPHAPTLFQTDHPAPYPVFEITQGQMPENGDDIMRTSRLAVFAARQALDQAGLAPETLCGLRVGVCIGTTVGSALNNEAFYRDYREGKQPDMRPIKRYLRSNPAHVLARTFKLTGPSQTVVNACSSGTDAIGIAAGWIRAGICDVAIAGGADELARVTYNGFISLKIHSQEPCRPFDVNRGGLNLGEGAGVLVLESERSRRARGAPEHGRVLSYGTACDAYHLTAPHPDGLGLRRALGEALALSGTQPFDIAFLNAHGTGTPDNDRVEGRVLCEILPGTPFLSTKGYTGHTLGAAGGLEAVFTLACLEQRMLPASAGFAETDPDCGATPVAQCTTIKGDVAVSQSLAFGGNNGVLVLARADQ